MFLLASMLCAALSVLIAQRALRVPSSFQIELPMDGLLLRKRREFDGGGPLRLRARALLRAAAYHVQGLHTRRLDALLWQKLGRAGFPGGMVPLEFRGALVLSMLIWMVMGQWCVLQLFGGLRWQFALFMSLFGLGFLLLWLGETERLRGRRINAGLPYLLDLLAMSMSAGMDLPGALHEIVRRRDGSDPLTEELDQLRREMAMGKTRRAALMSLNDRVESEYMAELVTAVTQADRTGTALAEVLKTQARVVRQKRYRRAEKLTGQLTTKLILPLSLFAVAALIIILAPLCLQLSEGSSL